MRIVFHRQREVAGRFAAGKVERVFATPDEFDDGQGKVCELLRRGGATTRQESFECDGSWCGGQRLLEFRRECDDARPAFNVISTP